MDSIRCQQILNYNEWKIGLVLIKVFSSINLQKLIEINRLIFVVKKDHKKLHNSTTHCCYLLQTKAKSTRNQS